MKALAYVFNFLGGLESNKAPLKMFSPEFSPIQNRLSSVGPIF